MPFLGKEAREQGYVLPNPFGISIIALHQQQPFDVESIGIVINGKQFQQINAAFEVSNLEIEDSTFTLRADVWRLPFFKGES